MSTGKKRTPCHCINLRRVAAHVTDYYSRVLKPCGLTVSQFSLLWTLDAMEQSNTTALAERVGLDRSTLVRNLKPLQDAGFIDDISGDGQRDRVLHVTDKGKRALEIGRPLWKSAQKEIVALLGPERLEVFNDVLHKLQRL